FPADINTASENTKVMNYFCPRKLFTKFSRGTQIILQRPPKHRKCYKQYRICLSKPKLTRPSKNEQNRRQKRYRKKICPRQALIWTGLILICLKQINKTLLSLQILLMNMKKLLSCLFDLYFCSVAFN